MACGFQRNGNRGLRVRYVCGEGVACCGRFFSSVARGQGGELFDRIAECGGVLGKPDVIESMAAHAIMSRVCRATTILILRALPSG